MGNLSPGEPTRYPNGVSTNEDVGNLGSFILPDPTSANVFFDDFVYQTKIAGDYTITSVGAGQSLVLADADGGIFQSTNAAADDDSNAYQAKSEMFLFEAGKKLFYKARFKVSDALQSVLAVGLQITDTTPGDVSDGVFFIKDDADNTLKLRVEKDGTATETDVLEMVDDTYVTVGFEYDGASKIKIFSANSQVGKSVTTNLPDDEVLTPSFFCENGEAVAKVFSIDYHFVAKAR